MRPRNYWLRISTLLTLLAIPTVQAGPLHDAAERGDLEQLKRLIAQGSDVNARDENEATPLHWAVYRGHITVARLLIAHGADVYANEHPFCAVPGQVASTAGDSTLTQLPNPPSANINENTDNGVTPLHWAAAGGYRAAVVLLISEGANVNAKTNESITPLQTATGMGHKNIVELLTQHGAKE